MVKILYVEDEVFLSKIVKESLESRGYVIYWVQDGAKALAAFEAFEPDICLLDIMLPHVDGFEIGRNIKKMSPKTPMLYLSAKDQTKDVIEGFKVGANDYIKKPCSLEELIVRIENLLRLTGQKTEKSENAEQIALSDFTFFTLKYQLLYKDGTVINLSHKEVELLKLFSQHVNEELDRQEILDKVWGDDSFFHSRNLDVYINKLRRYFQADENIRLITLRGVGYRFVVG